MKLYIAMLATLVAVTGCKKDDDTGAADDHGGDDDGGGDGGGGDMNACAELLDIYCNDCGVSEEECDAYTASIGASDLDESVCQQYIDAGVC